MTQGLNKFEKRTQSALERNWPNGVWDEWRDRWSGICSDCRRFGFDHEDAAEAIAESEGFDIC